jgi:hypothetical protein
MTTKGEFIMGQKKEDAELLAACKEAERKEAEELRTKILTLTNTVPKKIMNEAGYYAALNFKQLVTQARQVASHKNLNVVKLRNALGQIEGYWR